MRLTSIVHHIMPFVALAGGILVLLMPRLMNYIVAIYLILVGFIGLNSLFHFVRDEFGEGCAGTDCQQTSCQPPTESYYAAVSCRLA
jgi:hypothetical protein